MPSFLHKSRSFLMHLSLAAFTSSIGSSFSKVSFILQSPGRKFAFSKIAKSKIASLRLYSHTFSVVRVAFGILFSPLTLILFAFSFIIKVRPALKISLSYFPIFLSVVMLIRIASAECSYRAPSFFLYIIVGFTAVPESNRIKPFRR